MKIGRLLILVIFIVSISSCAFASPTLSRNSKGNEVITLQKRLYSIGYDITEIDGVFGNETERAVAAFQHDQKISVTGIVNNATWRALKKAKPISGRKIPDVKSQSISTVKGGDKLVGYGKTFIDSKQSSAIIKTAKKYMGVPYLFGGTTPAGFDCSGFLQYVFKQNGLEIPRLADEQYKLGKSAKVSQLEAGDLVFFSTYEAGASHCGIYVGDGKFLHTSSSKGVRIDSLSDDYWKPRFIGARKITA